MLYIPDVLNPDASLTGTLSYMYTPTILIFSHYLPTCLWRWNGQSVPKRRHIKFRLRGITQKKTYNIQNTAKVWNQEAYILIAKFGDCIDVRWLLRILSSEMRRRVTWYIPTNISMNHGCPEMTAVSNSAVYWIMYLTALFTSAL